MTCTTGSTRSPSPAGPPPPWPRPPPVQRRVRPAGHQAPRRADRHHHLPPAGHDQVRHPRHRAGHHRDPDRAGPAPGPRQRGHPRPADTAQAARPPQDARPGVTPGPGCQRRQRHHRLDLDPATPGAIPPPGRFFPGRPGWHPPPARRNPTPRPCPAWGSPPPLQGEPP